jgi:hypothetical protein
VLAGAAQAEETKIPAGVFINTQTQDQYLARDNLIGAKVHGPDGKIIGDIEDLIVNDYNQIVGVVMGTGGFAGFGEKKVGVNLSALKFEEADGKTKISLPQATHDVLGAAEAYKTTQPRKSLLERAQEKAQELTDKARSTSSDAVEKAKPSIEQAKDKALEAYEKAKEAAGPAIEAAKEAIGSALDEAKKAIEEGQQPPAEAPAPAAPEAPAEPAPEAPAQQ